MRYPKSGLYRRHERDVEAYAETFAEVMKNPKEVICAFFQVPDEAQDSITAEEIEDVSNFVLYAGKRLTNTALYAPLFEKQVSRGQIHGAMHQGAHRSYHDALHAMMAYDRSGGRSLAPAYIGIPRTLEEQVSDPAAAQEEAMVLLWQGSENFMPSVFRGEDPLVALQRTDAKNVAFTEARIRELVPLKEKNRLQYLLSVHEAYCAGLLMNVAGSKRMNEPIGKAFDVVANNRDPQYVRIAELLSKNAQANEPDPKILIYEFQRILQPLLQRLRHKRAAGTSLATRTRRVPGNSGV